MKVLIVTGLSGAGKSSVIKSLEDIGYYCIDNLPPNLMRDFIKISSRADEEINCIAFGIDLRAGKLFDEMENSIIRIEKKVDRVEILYLEASDESIRNRYKESRRSHPYSSDGTLIDGINLEREKLKDIRKRADYIIDTSNMNIHQLRDHIKKIFQPKKSAELKIILESFGFKKGIPLDVDMLFDLRFLPNPFYIEELSDKTGLDKKVRDYVMSFSESSIMMQKMNDMIEFLIPQFEKEGKNEIIIGMGCTGGNHRSVTFTFLMEEYLKSKEHNVTSIHRDMRR
ncbi:MAG: RNase adapter RapZ [Bacillota bacterium]|nr:RNase adapter RapZ [Bacillota bacterium]